MRADLGGQSEQDRARAQVGLVLQALGHALGNALDQKIDLGGNCRRHCWPSCRRSGTSRPRRPALGLVEIGEILREADDQVHLGEDGVDREI